MHATSHGFPTYRGQYTARRRPVYGLRISRTYGTVAALFGSMSAQARTSRRHGCRAGCGAARRARSARGRARGVRGTSYTAATAPDAYGLQCQQLLALPTLWGTRGSIVVRAVNTHAGTPSVRVCEGDVRYSLRPRVGALHLHVVQAPHTARARAVLHTVEREQRAQRRRHAR